MIEKCLENEQCCIGEVVCVHLARWASHWPFWTILNWTAQCCDHCAWEPQDVQGSAITSLKMTCWYEEIKLELPGQFYLLYLLIWEYFNLPPLQASFNTYERDFYKGFDKYYREHFWFLCLRWQISSVEADGQYLPLCPVSVPGAGIWQQQRRNCSWELCSNSCRGLSGTSGLLKGKILLLQMEEEGEEWMSCPQPLQLLPGRKNQGLSLTSIETYHRGEDLAFYVAL